MSPKKNIAIAYSIQLKNKKKKKMADGGQITAKNEKRPMPDELFNDKHEANLNDHKKAVDSEWIGGDHRTQALHSGGEASDMHSRISKDFDELLAKHDHDSVMEYVAGKLAEGGMVYDGHMDDEFPKIDDMKMMKAHGGEMEESQDDSMAEHIMKKRKAKKMADGGMVDIEENGKEQPNQYYKRNEDEVLKENYDDDMSDLDQPMDSNEKSQDIPDENEHDMINEIRKKLRLKRGF